MLLCSGSRCLEERSLAKAQLIEGVVLLIGQAQLDASHQDHSVSATLAGLANLDLTAAGPT